MDTKGGKPWWGGDGGVLNWMIGIDMYTLMCIKLMTNKKLSDLLRLLLAVSFSFSDFPYF